VNVVAQAVAIVTDKELNEIEGGEMASASITTSENVQEVVLTPLSDAGGGIQATPPPFDLVLSETEAVQPNSSPTSSPHTS
jgi:bacteriocin-like protein